MLLFGRRSAATRGRNSQRDCFRASSQTSAASCRHVSHRAGSRIFGITLEALEQKEDLDFARR